MRTIKIFIFVQLLNLIVLAQSNSFVAGVNGSYLIPIGTLSDRFKPTIGGSFFIGQPVSKDWTWYGRIEYFKFDEENLDRMFILRNLTLRGVTQKYKLSIPKLTMELVVSGISANANYNIINSEYYQGNLTFGFGVYYWQNDRGSYYDSLYYTIPNDTTFLAEYLNVPMKRQTDWSGGFNLGIDFNVLVIHPVWFNISAQYRVILGELWATLKLDQENIAGFQMADLKAGFKIKL
jgi:hypothetical protein